MSGVGTAGHRTGVYYRHAPGRERFFPRISLRISSHVSYCDSSEGSSRCPGMSGHCAVWPGQCALRQLVPPIGGCVPRSTGCVSLSKRLCLDRIDDGSVAADNRAGRQARLLNVRGVEDVHDPFTGCNQIVRDDPSMASPPDSLGAHDRASALPASDQEPREAGGKVCGQGIVGIVVKALHPPAGIKMWLSAFHLSAMAAKFDNMLIADLDRCQCPGKVFTVKLGILTRRRGRSHIDKVLDIRVPQQIDEFRYWPGRMAYCEKGAGHVPPNAITWHKVPHKERPGPARR